MLLGDEALTFPLFVRPGYGNVSYWSPIIAGTIVAIADTLAWLSMLCYISDSYPNVAGSAIAAFLIPSFVIAVRLHFHLATSLLHPPPLPSSSSLRLLGAEWP